MSRYINKDAPKCYGRNDFQYVDRDQIDSAPSIDLVTCAECKFKKLYDGETKYYYCALEDRPNRQWSVDDWNYCSWGERKENE